MSGEIEAAGDALTGGLAAGVVDHGLNPGDGHGGGKSRADAHSPCPNCGATLTGPYCAQCGQAAHIHRSIHSLGHDILHGVFHFEGKVWRTLPELAFHPGRLTRRFIDGERAKFVSPMALFLFTVFLMFAVFGFTGGALLDNSSTVKVNGTEFNQAGDWKAGLREEIAKTDREIATLEKQLRAPAATGAARPALERQLADLRDERTGMAAVADGDWAALAALERKDEKGAKIASGAHVRTGWKGLDDFLNKGISRANANPALLLYKLKTSGYKYSWALIPLSIPFLWLLFFWRRDVHLYDHAIFATYSISFMMLLLIVLSLAAAAGVGAAIWGSALLFLPPVHMYKQLRGAYGLSRSGALLRLMFLLAFSCIVLLIFGMGLIAMGVLE